jgi:ketosteroid isomerase-like protein
MSQHPNAAIVRTGYEAFAKGDLSALSAFLDDDIVWHESTPGFEGDYHGRDQVLALFGRIFQETGLEMSDFNIHDVLANDEHTVILHGSTLTRDGRTLIVQYADVYHIRSGRATEHWHLAVDPKAEQELFAS